MHVWEERRDVRAGGVGLGADTSSLVHHIVAEDVVLHLSGLVPGPPMTLINTAFDRMEREATHSAIASDQPSPRPPASVVWRQRPVPPPVRRLVIPWVIS